MNVHTLCCGKWPIGLPCDEHTTDGAIHIKTTM